MGLDNGEHRRHQGRPTSQRSNWWISSALPEKNFVEDLFYGFQRNAFPRKLFSTQWRKIKMSKNQVRLGYSLFLWGLLYGKIYLIYQKTSWKKYSCLNSYWDLPPTTRLNFSTQFESCSGMIPWDWSEGGGAELKVSLYIFGNTEMYHLCVQ